MNKKRFKMKVIPLGLFLIVTLFSGNFIEETIFVSAGSETGQVVVTGKISIVPAFPQIISITASDPDELDAIYGNGDVITVTFDKPTNRPQAATKTNLENLFTFSQNFGTDFIGSWTSASVLQITIVDATGATPPTIGGLTVTAKASGNLKNEAGTSLASTSVSPPLAGSFGDKAGPAFTSLVASDPSNDDAVYDAGDTITVRFNEDTNTPPVNTKAALDSLFTYTQGGAPANLGTNYAGTFTNSRTLVITILDATGATPPAVGALTLTVKASGNLRNDANTSLASTAVSPPLDGTFGTAPGPFFRSLVAADPDGGDAVYGADDTITATFSIPTNQPFGPDLIKSELDLLFSFSQDLGVDYTGFWVDPVTLVITVADPFGAAPPTVGGLQITAKPSGNLRDQANTSLPSTALSPLLSGNFGTKAGPAITSLVAADPDGGDAIYGNDDVLTVTFDTPTNRPSVATKANLNSLFIFSQNLGTNYVGTWITSSVLKITILDATGATPPTIGGLTLTAKASGNLKNEAGTSLASTSISPALAGSFGDKAGPAFTSLVASDPSNDDAVFDTGDFITARFDVDTNTPPVNSKAALDALFTFSQEIGDNYSGIWENPRTLRITVIDATVDTPPRIGELKLIVKESGNLRNSDNTSLASVAVSPSLTGTFGTAPGPRFVSLVAQDPDGADAVYSNGDTITIIFDTPTNRPPVATKANLDELFSFSQNLGSDYTGVWTDDVTLVITIVNAIGATPPTADTDGLDNGELRLTAKASGNLRNKANTSLPSTALSPLLTGNFGTKQGPQIITMVAGDPPPNVPGYSVGDTITITFDEKTNRPLAATRTDINKIFDFSQSLGAGYVGSWQSATVLVITITDTSGATPPVPSVLTATVKASANLKNEAGTSLASTSIAVLTGNFGLEPGPAIESATASDPFNDDAVFDTGDRFTLRFDKDTNQPFGPTLDRDELDSLMIFSQQIGDDYSGTWVNAKTLRITVDDATVDSPPQIGELQFTAKNNLLKTADLSSAFSTPVSPPLDGTFGNAPGPFITDLVARDPFGQDAVFGANDIITVVFDRPTNERFGPTLDKSELDSLFTFSSSLGTDYTGVWFEPEILEITIVNPGGANPLIGSFGLQVNGDAELKDAAGTSLSSTAASSPLVGNFGTKAGPQIVSIVAGDPPPTIPGFSVGDTITITFDEATNKPAVSNKAEIDLLFGFSDNLGQDYSGQWFDPRTLIITIDDATGGTASVGSTTVTVIGTGLNALKNAANTSLESDSTSPVLIGNFGQRAGPAIISLIAHDPDNLDSFFSDGDTLTVIFDTRTTEPPVATKAQIDSLFTFSQTIGDDYTGVWNNVGDLVITIVDGKQLPQAPIIGELQLTAKETGNLQATGGSLPSISVSPFVTGSWGNFIEQVSVCEGGEAFSTFPDGKTAEISYAGDEQCGGFTFEVATETTSNRIEFVGEPLRITPLGDTDCSVPPHCLLSFVFRENQIPLEDGVPVDPFTRIKILKDVNGDEVILQDFDGDGTVTQADLDATNEVFNGLPLDGITIGASTFDTPQTIVVALDDVRFEASATTPSNSKFAIGGIRALALGAVAPGLGPSPSPSTGPSTGVSAGAAGAGTGGAGGGNAASIGQVGFAGTLDSSQVKLYEATWDKCDKKMLRVIAGPAGPGLSVKAVAAMGGIIAMKEAAEQPFTKATVYETPISELETFIRVQVEGVIGREPSLAQRSLDLRECSGGIGGYSETEESVTPPLGLPAGSFPSTASLFENGLMFDTRYNDIDFRIGYWIPQGQIKQIDVDEDEKSITFEFSQKVSGKVLLSLPRGMISAGNDQFVLLNPATSQRISYEVIESGSQYVTLETTLPTEMDSIMIVGTSVVPEFGAITTIVLLVAIIGIVTIIRTRQFLITNI